MTALGRGLYPIFIAPHQEGLTLLVTAYWMASFRPLPARKPGVLEAGM